MWFGTTDGDVYRCDGKIVTSLLFGEHRVFGPRENADVLKTRGEAHTLIDKLPAASFGHAAGFTFSVESAE